MRIAIDASRAVRPQPTGTELYSARIIEYLAKYDHENEYLLYSPTRPTGGPLTKLPDNYHWRIIPFKRFWSQIRLPIALWFDKPDLLFVPAHVLPLYIPKKTIVTLHDIAFDVFPEAYSLFGLWYQRYATRRACKAAAAIITPSEATKKDLIRVYHADAKKITTIHLGFDKDRFSKKNELQGDIKALQPYFLMLGRLEKRKNTAGAIKAFGQFRKQHPNLAVKLILIGKPGHGYQDIVAAKQSLPVATQADIIEIGYAETNREAYMAAATAFLYPSLYEGFGIPLLEAMASGTPIITSDISSIPEVVDDAAILVNPDSQDELVKAMTILATDRLSRQQISKRGKERVKQFSWDKTALKTLELFDRVSHS